MARYIRLLMRTNSWRSPVRWLQGSATVGSREWRACSVPAGFLVSQGILKSAILTGPQSNTAYLTVCRSA
jgi:hypothetical protein